MNRPFDEAKYEALLEGLEISIVSKSSLERTLRFDSEFYLKDFLLKEEILNKLKLNSIDSVAKVTDGNHMSISDRFREKGIPYYRGQDIHNFFIEHSSPICIDSKTFNIPHLKRSHLKKGDVLLSIVGTIGGVSVVGSNKPATCNCKLAIFRPHSINGYFLATYLKTKYGQNQIKKHTRGAVQKGLILEDMDQILVPDFSTDFQNQISSLIANSKEIHDASKEKYKKAEALLLQILGLEDYNLNKKAVNIKSFKESFVKSRRLDAEFYQKKFDIIEAAFNKFERVKLRNLVIYPISSGITPKAGGQDYAESSNEGYSFVRAVDINNGLVDASNLLYIKPHIHNGILKRTKLKKYDVLFTIAGTVGRCGIFLHDFDANINQAVSILRFPERKIKRLYLICLFNSEIGKLFISKYARQGLQTNLNLNEVAEISIPIIDFENQSIISNLIEDSMTINKKSLQLLEIGKRAVEKAIEEGENKAIDFIKEKLNELDIKIN